MISSPEALTPENLFANPYPVYARLRREAPVCRFDATGEWFVTRYSHCSDVGINHKVFGPSGSEHRPEARVMGLPNVLSMSGPEHQCLREGIEQNLKPEQVNSYIEELARPIVQKYIAAIKDRGSADLTRELYEPISVRVVASVLGLHDVPNEKLAYWFHSMNAGLQNVANDASIWTRCDAALAEMDAAIRPIVERVTTRPDDSMISHIVHVATTDGKPRTFEQINPSLRVILLGGLQEPGHGAANAVYGLLLDPLQSAAVAKDPAGLSMPSYDEGLRWISPIGVTPRIAGKEFELAGVTIPEGASVAIVMASANRDETRFESPDEFRLDRSRKPHLAFGFRPHFCSGHYLSRKLGQIAIDETFRILGNLRLDPEQEVVTQGWRFRGVTRLPARWDV